MIQSCENYKLLMALVLFPAFNKSLNLHFSEED